MKCPQHYLTDMQEVILFYNGLDISTKQILDTKGAIPTKTSTDEKITIQEMAEYSQKWHNGTSKTRSTETSDGLPAIQEQHNNLRREIKKVNEKEKGFGSLPSSTKTNSRDHIQSILVAVEIDMTLICHIGSTQYAISDPQNMQHPKGIVENVLVGIGKFVFPIDFKILDMPEDINVPLILKRPFFSTTQAKVNVFKRKITLRVWDEKIIFKSVKPASSLIKKVYMLSLRERMDFNLEARLMGETFILNRSFDLLYTNYIELNDLNKPLELRRNQVDDLKPTVKEGKVVNEPMMDIIKIRCDFIDGLNDYPSYYDYDRKIYVNCAYNLKLPCMIGFEHVSAHFLPNLSINIMFRKFYNSIMKDKIDYEGKNVVKTFINVPAFVGKFCVVTNFAVMEDMDIY
ncbi:putative reverse transcriptase domain-containing protein [Tanacetum coccineum]